MILAAGFGTRLKPLTDKVPKALVKFEGSPLIKTVMDKLIGLGIKEVVINTHHLADKIKEYFEQNDFGINVRIIYEPEILGTGGGIKNAAKYFADCEDFLVHNTDVISDIDLEKMYTQHRETSSFATLAIHRGSTSRPLLLDSELMLTGRKNNDRILRYRTPVGEDKPVGFCGIHIISTEIFKCFTEEGFFDIFTTYFRLLKKDKKIMGYDIGDKFWKDAGKNLPAK